jgi:hypothetical protein
MEEPMI